MAYEEVPRIGQVYKKEMEEEYAFQLRELLRTKDRRLIDHDVSILALVTRQVCEHNEKWIFLTWDAATISVGGKVEGCGWVVSPEVLCDFTAYYEPPGDSELCALAHSVARAQITPLQISAQVLDQVVAMTGDKLPDWAFRQKIDEFTNQLLARIDLNDARYGQAVEKETSKFLRNLGVNVEETINESEGVG